MAQRVLAVQLASSATTIFGTEVRTNAFLFLPHLFKLLELEKLFLCRERGRWLGMAARSWLTAAWLPSQTGVPGVAFASPPRSILGVSTAVGERGRRL